MDRQKLENFIYEQFEKDDVKHPFACYVSGVLLGMRMASVFFLNQKEDSDEDN